MPTVSVLIPVHNCEKYIAQAIESALDQADEVIVYDDASTDNTREIVRRYSVKVHYGVNRVGQQKACNFLVMLSSCEYLQFLDADDYLLPGKIQAQLGVGPVSYTNFFVEKYVNRQYRETYLARTDTHPLIESLLRYEWMPATGCFLFHKNLFKRLQWTESESYRYGMHDRKITLDLLKMGVIPAHVPHDGYVHRCGWSGSQISQGERYMDVRKHFTRELYTWAQTQPQICEAYDLDALARQTWKRIQTEESLSRC